MSGGSYGYLYGVCDLEELLEKERALCEVAERLAGLGYARDAALETEQLLVMLRQWSVGAEVRIKRLRDVWCALEMWDSGDRDESGVHEALAKYRGEAGSA